jgi:two-component system, cell cycle sensor histidine kinase and response regulator CckA
MDGKSLFEIGKIMGAEQDGRLEGDSQLERTVEEVSSVPDRQSSTRQAIHTCNETILVVDDEAMLLNMIQKLLQMNGYNVITASCGVEALSILEGVNASVDLVLTDILMPKMTGDELVTRIQSMHPDIGALYMSGYCEKNKKIPYDLFIAKPFCMDDLLLKMRSVLDGVLVE